MCSVASSLSEKSGVVPPMDLALLLLCSSAPGDWSAHRVSDIKTELCRSTVWSLTIVHISVSYQAGWEYPKRCHDCQAGKRHESWNNTIYSEVTLWFQLVVSLLWGLISEVFTRVSLLIYAYHLIPPPWQSGNQPILNENFPKHTLYFSPLVTSKVGK